MPEKEAHEEQRILEPTVDEITAEFYATPTPIPIPIAPVTDQTDVEGEAEADAVTPPAPLTWRQRLSVLEPPVVLKFIAIFLTGAVVQNQVLFQTCVAVYHYNASECQPLLGVAPKTDESKQIELEIQPYVARIIMANSVFSSFMPAILNLFIGPWSDKYGRRPVLLTTFAASLIGNIILTTFAAISTVTPLNPWVYTLAVIPEALTGGVSAMMIMVICYVSDVSTKDSKAKRMFLLDLAMSLGVIIGNLSSSFILAATNTVVIFGISTILVALGLLYVIIFIDESLDVEQASIAHKIREFFRFGLLEDLIKTCLRPRENYNRAVIWIVLCATFAGCFIMMGEANVFYLFVRTQFNVTLRDFTIFGSVVVVLKMLGGIAALAVLKKIFKIRLTVIIMIAIGSSVLESTVRATAQEWWQMYMGAGIGFMSGVGGALLQATLSLVVRDHEIGKIFALMSCVQSLIPLVASPLYTTVYNATLETYPGFFNLISIFIHLISFSLITALLQIQKIEVRNATKPEVPA